MKHPYPYQETGWLLHSLQWSEAISNLLQDPPSSQRRSRPLRSTRCTPSKLPSIEEDWGEGGSEDNIEDVDDIDSDFEG